MDATDLTEQVSDVTESRDYVQSIDRAFRILDAFPADRPQLTLAEIVARTGFSRTASFRILNTLIALRVVARTHDGRAYRLGFKLWELGMRQVQQLDVRRLALPFLRDIEEHTEDTCSLCVIDEGEALCVERVEGRHLVRIMSLRLGGRLPLYAGASPLVLLSGLPDDEIGQLLQTRQIQRFTENTLTDPLKVLEAVRMIRLQGYALSQEDVTLGGAAVAAPVFDHNSAIVASISISGVVSRFSPERMPFMIERVIEAANGLSHELGWSGGTEKR
jgi:DNA-binding IclR family transcriptional regulator